MTSVFYIVEIAAYRGETGILLVMWQVSGMCGNFNGKIDDETLTADGDNIKNITMFVLAWKTTTQCDSLSDPDYRGACSLNTKALPFAESRCLILKQGQKCNRFASLKYHLCMSSAS